MTVLNTAKQEIDGKRYAESFEVQTSLDEVLLKGYLSPPDIQLFVGKAHFEHIFELVETAVTCEVASQLQCEEITLEIPVIKGSQVRLYHPSTLQVTATTLKQDTRIDNCTSYCYIHTDTLLCCGGYNHNEVYAVQPRKRTAEVLESMNVARFRAGLWNYRNKCVYIFGGSEDEELSKTAEKYDLGAKTWINLRNLMHGSRNNCSVCEHSDHLYISGRDGIEQLNLHTEKFTLLSFERSKSVPILFCDGDNLYCVRDTEIEQADLSKGLTAASFVTKAPGNLYQHQCEWGPFSMKCATGEFVYVRAEEIRRFSPAQLQCTLVKSFKY